MKWYEKPEVFDYIVNAYQGVDESGRKRQFVWEEKNGDVVIGNSRAFSDHVRTRFALNERSTAWMDIHALLRAVGEIVQAHSPHLNHPGKRFKNQEPEIHVLVPASQKKDEA